MIQFQLKLTILSSFIPLSVPNEGQFPNSLTDELMASSINLAFPNYSIYNTQLFKILNNTHIYNHILHRFNLEILIYLFLVIYLNWNGKEGEWSYYISSVKHCATTTSFCFIRFSFYRNNSYNFLHRSIYGGIWIWAYILVLYFNIAYTFIL